MLRKHTRKSLLAALAGVAKAEGTGRVTMASFRKATGVSYPTVVRLFGTWNRFVAAGGLTPNDKTLRLSEQELLRALRDAWLEAKGPVPPSVYDRTGKYCLHPYRRRWKTWAGALEALLAWIELNDKAFPYRAQLEEEARAARRRLGSRRCALANQHYGPVINFRSFLHAPTCESGVILLFGMVAGELGFVIERMAPDFPDCEAKRRVPGHADALELVRIEFEHRSRSFRSHGHDAAGCDLIVCWEHDWPECPLPVLELKSAIEGMRLPKTTSP